MREADWGLILLLAGILVDIYCIYIVLMLTIRLKSKKKGE